MDSRKLPDLPGSLEKDLAKNEYHSFYKKTTKQVWEAADISHPEVAPHNQCDHNFRYVKGGVECQKCFMGLMGHLDIKGGKLFYKGQQLFGER